jgi:hypothetical protein
MNAKTELLEIIKNTELLLKSDASSYSSQDKKRIIEINQIALKALNDKGGKISKIDLIKISIELLELFEIISHWT